MVDGWWLVVALINHFNLWSIVMPHRQGCTRIGVGLQRPSRLDAPCSRGSPHLVQGGWAQLDHHILREGLGVRLDDGGANGGVVRVLRGGDWSDQRVSQGKMSPPPRGADERTGWEYWLINPTPHWRMRGDIRRRPLDHWTLGH